MLAGDILANLPRTPHGYSAKYRFLILAPVGEEGRTGRMGGAREARGGDGRDGRYGIGGIGEGEGIDGGEGAMKGMESTGVRDAMESTEGGVIDYSHSVTVSPHPRQPVRISS